MPDVPRGPSRPRTAGARHRADHRSDLPDSPLAYPRTRSGTRCRAPRRPARPRSRPRAAPMVRTCPRRSRSRPASSCRPVDRTAHRDRSSRRRVSRSEDGQRAGCPRSAPPLGPVDTPSQVGVVVLVHPGMGHARRLGGHLASGLGRNETERGDGEPAFGDSLAVVLDGDASWREGPTPNARWPQGVKATWASIEFVGSRRPCGAIVGSGAGTGCGTGGGGCAVVAARSGGAEISVRDLPGR
jgi:hypothetical protein